MNNRGMFVSYSSYVNILYFIGVMVINMFFMHPVILIISFVSSLTYSLYLNGMKSLKFDLFVLFPLLLFIILVNPLINHQGTTILFYINNQMITKESILYGIFAGMMIINMFLYFSSFNKIMTGDKIMSVLKFVSRKLSLIFVMTLRFVPRYKNEFNKIKVSQQCLNEGLNDGNFFDRIRHGSNMMSSLVTFALEDGIDTADTMIARGYGLKNKSNYKREKFTNDDKVFFTLMMILLLIVIIGIIRGQFYINFFPDFIFTELSIHNALYFVSYFIFAMVPMIIEIKEALVWNLSK